MSVEYSKSKVGDGITLTRIYDDKFKTVAVNVSFIIPIIDSKTCCANSVLQTVLLTSSKTYPSRTEQSIALTNLYGASISTQCNKIGDYHMIGLSAGCIADRFAINNEAVISPTTNILLDCLLKPDINDGKFNEKYFRIRQQDMIDTINATINNKRGYAIKQARKLVFENEPSAVSVYGELVDAESLTNDDLMKAYRSLLKSAQIEITIAGNSQAEIVAGKIISAFAKLERENVVKAYFVDFSPMKPQPAQMSEELDINQAKMVMAFKSDYDNCYVNKLACAILGGTTFSKFFANVREKLSLCYYCAAMYSEYKGTLLVDSGVELSNIEKAKDEILRQIDAVAKGDFTDEELLNTKLYLCSGYKGNYDSVQDLVSWDLTQMSRGEKMLPEQVCKIIMNISREQVSDAVNAMKLDTIYVVKPMNEGGEG